MVWGINLLSFFFVLILISLFLIINNIKYSYVIIRLILYGLIISSVISRYYNLYLGLLFLLVYVGRLLLFMLYVLTIVRISEKTYTSVSIKLMFFLLCFIDFVPVEFIKFTFPNIFCVYSTIYIYMLVLGFLLRIILYISLELLYFN